MVCLFFRDPNEERRLLLRLLVYAIRISQLGASTPYPKTAPSWSPFPWKRKAYQWTDIVKIIYHLVFRRGSTHPRHNTYRSQYSAPRAVASAYVVRYGLFAEIASLLSLYGSWQHWPARLCGRKYALSVQISDKLAISNAKSSRWGSKSAHRRARLWELISISRKRAPIL